SHGDRSTAGARRFAGEVDRCRHAQRDGVSGGDQMRIISVRTKRLFFFASFASFAFLGLVGLRAQTVKLDPALLGKPPIDAWPTYHGDYTGRRFSPLKQIDTGNVKNLSLAWVYRLNTSSANAIVGGEGPDTPPGGPSGSNTIKSTPLMLNGILYFST